jgi:hypothetical protein
MTFDSDTRTRDFTHQIEKENKHGGEACPGWREINWHIRRLVCCLVSEV